MTQIAPIRDDDAITTELAESRTKVSRDTELFHASYLEWSNAVEIIES